MKTKLLYLLILMSSSTLAQDLQTYLDHVDSFLNQHVKNGLVDYKTIRKDQSQLQSILSKAEKISLKASDAKHYQAFWINSYNIAVINGIIDNYPVKSPLDKKGFFDETTYNLGRMSITLNDIENKLLREKFNDPRVHFVLVCGANGCPPLISNAYSPETLDAQLDAQTRNAINGNFIKVNGKKKKVEVSEIMKWYRSDFIQNGTTEIDFINTYRNEKLSKDYSISYFSYDWSLNKQ